MNTTRNTISSADRLDPGRDGNLGAASSGREAVSVSSVKGASASSINPLHANPGAGQLLSTQPRPPTRTGGHSTFLSRKRQTPQTTAELVSEPQGYHPWALHC